MALNGSRSAISSCGRTLTARQSTLLAAASSAPLRQLSASTRHLSSSPALGAAGLEDLADTPRPRWSHTPERMRGPGFSINTVKDPKRKIWLVNEDPKKLDAVYNRLLGQQGDRMLPDEIKWLAVTHKSFDQGRRGYNTKLAYFGRMILALETTRSIVTTPILDQKDMEDSHGREPFRHPAITNVDKLSYRQPGDTLDRDRITQLAIEVGLPEVVRWKPRLPENLEASGVGSVLNTTIFAIVGAISLQQGADVASRVVREKILKRLEA